MTPDQVRLVQESFAKLVPIADQAASMFYERLFEIAPQVRAMFPPDMAEQQRKLMATLTIVVGGLSNLESILPAASSLAPVMSPTAPGLSTIPWSGRRCCGRW